MKKLIFPILVLLLYACQADYKYPKDNTISQSDGFRADSMISYIPNQIKVKGDYLQSNIDNSYYTAYNDLLSDFEEPILYNYYLKDSIYRFTCPTTLNKPVVFSLKRSQGKTWLITKMYSKFQEERGNTDSFISDFNIHLRDLTEEQSMTFDILWANLNFTEQVISKTSTLTNKEVLIEMHLRKQYYYIFNDSTDQNTLAVLTFLKELSTQNFE